MPGRFDIFQGSPETQPLWLEAATGLSNAVARMEERARAKPGNYFVYDAERQSVVASIDTVDSRNGNSPAQKRGPLR
jgi:hypothetical protein